MRDEASERSAELHSGRRVMASLLFQKDLLMESPHAKFGAHWDHEPREQTSARQRLGERQSSAALGPAQRVQSARGLAQSKTWRFMESLQAIRARIGTMTRSCRRLPRRNAAKTVEPAGEAGFANRSHAFTGVATSRFMGSTRAHACSRRRPAGGFGGRRHDRGLQAVGAILRRGAASSTRGACGPRKNV